MNIQETPAFREETIEQIRTFAEHSAPAHIHGWRTPSGHTITTNECPACGGVV